MFVHDDARSDDFIAINIILASFGIISLISSFEPRFLWGLNHVGYFPLWQRLALTGALIAFCIPPFARMVSDHLSRATITIPRPYEIIFYILLFGAMVALFILFSSRNHLLGDGYVIEGTIRKGFTFSPTEPLEYILHWLLFGLIGGVRGVYFSYAITSYLSGVAFLVIIYIFLKDKVGVVFALAVAFAFANMQFFFGYMENYTTSLVLITLYLLSAWRDLSERKISSITVIVLAVAICFHIDNSIYLVSLGYLYLAKTESRRTGIIWAVVLLGTIVLGVLYLKTFTKLHIEDIFVPFLPTSENPYYLFSSAHIADLISVWLLSFPLLIFCPIFLKDWDQKGRWFFAATAIPSLLYVIMIDPKLGAPRDWDMMSLPAAAIMVFIWLSFSRENSRWRNVRFAIVVPLLLFSFLHTGSWIAQNSHKDTGYAWLRPLIDRDKHYSSDYFQGYRNKSWAAIVETDYKDYKEAVRANEAIFAAAPNDTFNTCKLVINYLANGDSIKCQEIVNEFWPKFVENQDAISVLGAMMFKMKKYPESEQIFRAYLLRGGTDPGIFHNMGALME
ncbi:MAG TPA: hypothetical protein DCZ43_01410, partial [candidate division Zixibacteria bacterium]|nr:hypothetical protein [candidate division Zixibacteria bacterium]